MPFGHDCEYPDFDACIRDNQDKDDPEAFCAALQDETEGQCDVTTTTTDLAELPPTRLDMPVLRAVRPGVEVRAVDDGPGTLAGHFSVFGSWFEINSWFEGHFMERVQRGSFAATFNAWRNASDPHRIQVLLEHGHDPTVGDKPLGVTESLAEDSIGAAYEARLFDASYVRDLVPALQAGVYGASYRFRVIRDEWSHEPGASEHNPDGIPERTITEQQAFEFGPTVFPASPTASAGLRSLTDQYYEQLRALNPVEYTATVERVRSLRTAAQYVQAGLTPESAAERVQNLRTSADADAANSPSVAPPRGTQRTLAQELRDQVNLWKGSRS